MILAIAKAPSPSSTNATISTPASPNRDGGLRTTGPGGWKLDDADQLEEFMNSEGRSSTGSISQS